VYIGKFRIVQYDCPIVRLTDKMEYLKMRVIGVNNSHLNEGVEILYAKAKMERKDDSEILFKNIEKEPSVKKYEVVSKRDGEISLIMRIKKTNAMEVTANTNSYTISPWLAESGSEWWTLFFTTRKQASRFQSLVKEKDDIIDKKIIEVPDEVVIATFSNLIELSQFMNALSSLTEKQLNVLRLAVESGYFEWPRRKNTNISSPLKMNQL